MGAASKSRVSGCLAGLLVFASLAASHGATTNHFVFAHYMVCFATYGATVANYQREIREAQAAGLDGFALNVGAWSGPDTYYKERVRLLFDAAEASGSDFKLFFSVEFTNTADIVNMVAAYATRSNMFRQDNKVVLSTFGQNSLDWSNQVFQPLKAQGIQIFFTPFFWPEPAQELPSYSDAQHLLQKYGSLLDGLFLFGAAGLPAQLAQCNSNYTRAAHNAGKISMASVSPHYWGANQPSNGRRYFEYDGGEGISVQWSSILTSQPDWVEIVTWNDFNESTYVSPVSNPGDYFADLKTPVRSPHAGYLELMRYYISLYKTGQPVDPQGDSLFCTYRTHPKAAVASQTNDVRVTTFIGDVRDVVYATAILAAPAELEIVSGDLIVSNSLPAGLSHWRTPFAPGPQKFTLKRTGNTVLTVQGPEILSNIQYYDFFPATGFAYRQPPPPARLRITGEVSPP